MEYKKKLDEYKIQVEKQEFIPNKENPQKIVVTFSFTHEGEEYEITPPAFKPRQVATGQWEQQACLYVDDKIEEIEGKSKHEIPDLEGEEVKNSGYDHTGTQRNYPEQTR